MRLGRARNSETRRHDREILRLALPALGALAIAATLLSTGLTLFNFLTYGTMAHVARLNVLMAVRLVTCGARFVGRRWAVVGA